MLEKISGKNMAHNGKEIQRQHLKMAAMIPTSQGSTSLEEVAATTKSTAATKFSRQVVNMDKSLQGDAEDLAEQDPCFRMQLPWRALSCS
jgi:hypothetical protein